MTRAFILAVLAGIALSSAAHASGDGDVGHAPDANGKCQDIYVPDSLNVCSLPAHFSGGGLPHDSIDARPPDPCDTGPHNHYDRARCDAKQAEETRRFEAAEAKAKADAHTARMVACDKLPTWLGALACRFDSN